MKKRNGQDAAPGAVETLALLKKALAKHADRILALAAKASRQAYTAGVRDAAEKMSDPGDNLKNGR